MSDTGYSLQNETCVQFKKISKTQNLLIKNMVYLEQQVYVSHSDIHWMLKCWLMWFAGQDAVIIQFKLHFSVRRRDSHLLKEPVRRSVTPKSVSQITITGTGQLNIWICVCRWPPLSVGQQLFSTFGVFQSVGLEHGPALHETHQMPHWDQGLCLKTINPVGSVK